MSVDERTITLLERAAVAEEAGAVLRHDLRNKLASIRNAAFYLRRKVERTEIFETDTRVPLFFKLIDDELVAAEKLMSERVSLAHLFGAGATPTRIADAVASALDLAMVPGRIRVERSLDETDAMTASANELILLIRSLVDNAVEAMGETGTLTIRTRRVDRATVLEVEDTGPPIEAADRARALEPFSSTKPGHTGIGLNVVRRIAERYAGKIAIEPSASGTLVRITFAVSPAPRADAP